jgi:hypothetical protein
MSQQSSTLGGRQQDRSSFTLIAKAVTPQSHFYQKHDQVLTHVKQTAANVVQPTTKKPSGQFGSVPQLKSVKLSRQVSDEYRDDEVADEIQEEVAEEFVQRGSLPALDDGVRSSDQLLSDQLSS